MKKLNKVLIDLNEREIKENFVIILPFGDFHYGHENFNEKLFKKVYNWILKNKNVFVIGMGDYMEMADSYFGTKHQTEKADDQITYIKNIFDPIAKEGRLIGLHYGNHEYRPERKNYANPIKTICDLLSWEYLGEGMIHEIVVKKGENEQRYFFYTTHGGTGAYTIGGRINAIDRLRKIAPAECYCMGHTHDLQHIVTDFFVPTEDCVKNRPIHLVTTGSYLEYWGSYAHRKGFPPARQGSPKIKLHIKKHRISVSEA